MCSITTCPETSSPSPSLLTQRWPTTPLSLSLSHPLPLQKKIQYPKAPDSRLLHSKQNKPSSRYLPLLLFIWSLPAFLPILNIHKIEGIDFTLHRKWSTPEFRCREVDGRCHSSCSREFKWHKPIDNSIDSMTYPANIKYSLKVVIDRHTWCGVNSVTLV